MENKDFSIPAADIHVDMIIANPDNTNEMTDDQVKRLAEEFKEVGMIDPVNLIPMSDGKYMLLGGEHRWRAAKLAGMTHIPSLIHTDSKWQDKSLLDLQTFKLNAIHGKISMKKFTDFYHRMVAQHGIDKVQRVLAIENEPEWKKLTKNIYDSLRASGASQDVLDEARAAEKKAKNPDDLAKMLEKIFRKQAQQISSNTIVFQYDKNEYIMLKANADVYVQMKKIVEFSTLKNQDVNEVLKPALESVVKSLEQVK